MTPLGRNGRVTKLVRVLARTATASLLLTSLWSFAQTTVGTGSIVGTVTDPTGAVISGAKVLIINVDTQHFISVTTNTSGSFNSGALVPGHYKAKVSGKGFATAQASLNVMVGNTATINVRLEVGQENEIVEVQDSELRVNIEEPTVQGVLNADQI